MNEYFKTTDSFFRFPVEYVENVQALVFSALENELYGQKFFKVQQIDALSGSANIKELLTSTVERVIETSHIQTTDENDYTIPLECKAFITIFGRLVLVTWTYGQFNSTVTLY
jgi:hypothetical protein